MKYKIYIILSVLSVLSLLSFQNIFAQENSENKSNESIYSYLSAEEAFFIINYSTLDELKIIALALGIKFSDDITLDEIKKLLYEYYNFTEIKQKESEDILFIKSTDIINISDENRVIDLIGNNIIIYKSNVIL